LEATRSPEKVIPQAGGATKYIGEDATAIMNSEGKAIATWGRPRSPVPNQ
jgi:hypothetical protein